jgi:hypothetical protein
VGEKSKSRKSDQREDLALNWVSFPTTGSPEHSDGNPSSHLAQTKPTRLEGGREKQKPKIRPAGGFGFELRLLK